jgi:hypothetical protein
MQAARAQFSQWDAVAVAAAPEFLHQAKLAQRLSTPITTVSNNSHSPTTTDSNNSHKADSIQQDAMAKAVKHSIQQDAMDKAVKHSIHQDVMVKAVKVTLSIHQDVEAKLLLKAKCILQVAADLHQEATQLMRTPERLTTWHPKEAAQV